jgi:hypothetical protein
VLLARARLARMASELVRQMLEDRFCQQQIMSDPHLQITRVSSS